MNQHLSSASLKTLAKGQLLGKYGTVVRAAVLMWICILSIHMSVSFLIGTNTVISVLLYNAAQFLLQLLVGFFLAGEAYIYLKVACGQKPSIGDLFHCFGGDTSKVLHLQAVSAGISILCSLPAMILGIFALRSIAQLTEVELNTGNISGNAVLFLAYVMIYLAGTIISLYIDLILSQIYYLMLDFPEYSAKQILKMSIQLMKGHKGRLFYIQLSFIPLLLLSFLSCGIALLWLYPYMQATYANFYLDLVRKKND